MTTFTLFLGDDTEVQLPTRWEICGCCEGKGTSSRFWGAITQADRGPGGMWDDPEAFEDYKNGLYDRRCDECRGTGKVQVANERHMTAEQIKAWREQLADLDEYERERAFERRMGA